MSPGRRVTEEKAKEILEKLDPWLDKDKHPPLDEFTDRLDAIVETVLPVACIARLYVNLDGALTPLRRALPAAKFHLSAMETAAAKPEIAPFIELLKLDEVRRILAAIDKLDLTLTRAPGSAGTADKRKRGTKPKDWYVGLVRDLVEVAREIGIPFSTDCNGAAAKQHLTALAKLVYEVEGFLPKEVRSNSLTACKQHIVRDLPAALKLLDEDRDLEPVLSENQLSHM
jgi:hypothetical protein